MANKDVSFIKGLFVGTFVSAGTFFLFKTKKGKEIRKKMREEYPEVFAELDDLKDKFADKVEDVKEDLNKSSKNPVIDNAGEKIKEIAGSVKSTVSKVQKKLTPTSEKSA